MHEEFHTGRKYSGRFFLHIFRGPSLLKKKKKRDISPVARSLFTRLKVLLSWLPTAKDDDGIQVYH